MLSSLRQQLVSQFRQPRGVLGHLAGWIMATRASNRRRNLWTVDLLDIQPGDHVLEIGFGPGVALEATAARANQGSIVGVDHSTTMLAAAARRNRDAILTGRMRLATGSADQIDGILEKQRFHHIYAVNVAFFWSDPVETIRALARQLVPGGQLALTLQPRAKGATRKDSLAAGELISGHMRAAGLTDIRTAYLESVKPTAVCVIGRAPLATTSPPGSTKPHLRGRVHGVSRMR